MNEKVKSFITIFSFLTVYLTIVFVANNVLTVYLGWPGIQGLIKSSQSLTTTQIILSSIQWLSYILIIGYCFYAGFKIKDSNIFHYSNTFSNFSSYVARSAFWTIFLIGVVDVIISLLVSEKILDYFLSGSALNFFTKPSSRVLYIHLPLACIGFIIGYIKKTPGFIWFATLVVFAETAIVITRYVFYYEQAFMGDLVRLWYAAIFLFSSGYTLLKDGHVRVDILYVKFSEKGKAIANIAGSILFGIPLCALTLFFGLQGRTSIINAPVLSFEITQQGVSGMYIKYLLAAFLGVFAITMIFQFASLILSSLNQITKRSS